MEHDQRVCPRCGEPTGGSGFCRSCRSQLDSATGEANRAESLANDQSYLPARALREVLRLEEALAAASQGISDRIAAGTPGAAVEVEPAPLSAEADTVDTNAETLGRATLMSSVEDRMGRGPWEVARFEDVMTIAPNQTRVPAERPASVSPPLVEETVETPRLEPREEPRLEPREEPRLPTPPETPREVVALDPPAAQPRREAFWFEYAPALKSNPVADPDPEPKADPVAETVVAPEPEPAPHAAKTAASDEQPVTSSNHWIAALCLLALIALVVALTGRKPRRLGAGKTV